MTDRSPDQLQPADAKEPTREAHSDSDFSPSRRKLTGAALGVSAVFTLASRPVWANQCTISGMASGNLSAPQGAAACTGCTPGYWMQCQHLDSWAATGFKPNDKFNTVFGVTQYINPKNNKPYTLLQCMGLRGNGSCTADEDQPDCGSKPHGLAIGNMGCDPVSPNLAFHAVAALLNAAHPSVNYGYTAGELTALFRNNLHRATQLTDSLAMLNERGCPLN